MRPSEMVEKVETKRRHKDDQTVTEMAKETGLSEKRVREWAVKMIRDGKWTRYRCRENGSVVFVYHVER